MNDACKLVEAISIAERIKFYIKNLEEVEFCELYEDDEGRNLAYMYVEEISKLNTKLISILK